MEEIKAQDQQVPVLRMDVASVLRKQDKAPCKEYDILLNFLAAPSAETHLLSKYLCQLRDCVTLVTKDHEVLVGIILNMDWLSRDPALTREYKPLILNLVSAHPYYLRACVRMMVKRFLLPGGSKRTSLGGDKYPDKATRESEEVMFTHVHELLKAVASIVPSTRTVVMQLMRECFPYHTRDVFSHEAYTKNLLLVIQYIPDLRQQILELLAEKMLQLDVRAPRNDIVEAEDSSDEEDEEAEDGAMFKMDGIEEERKRKRAKAVDLASHIMNHEEALRLDIMMDIMINYIHSTCHPKGVFDWEITKKLYRELLSVFDLLIFPTHASCHAQFLLFYIISFRKELLVGFLDYLWKKVKTPMTQNVFRQAAAGYLGSLLARVEFIHISTLKTTVKIMTDWLHDYLNHLGTGVVHADLAHHAPFYAVCQSIFYVFCFRSQQLLDNDKGYKWADSLGFQRLVNCSLNPLRVCLPLVCSTFASVTRMHQLALCDTVIQRNNRLKFISSGDTLEAYFPFDPYLLKRSSHWIKPLYRKYEGTLPDIKKESDVEDEDDFAPDEAMETSLGASPLCTSGDKLDFMKYSISPGFKL